MTSSPPPVASNKDHTPEGGPAPDPPEAEPVWTYRGYRLRSSEFTTAMVHFFRAEVQRANVWRQRLDTTTNWAVVTTGAAIALAFNKDVHHSVILLNVLLITLFLYTEARRYRYFELWSYRIRLIETDFYAPMLVPPFHPSPDWAESLAENLLHPNFPISMWEAFGRRYRRNYLWIYLILSLAWIAKILPLTTDAGSWPEFLKLLSIGFIPGEYVLLAGIAFNAVLLLVGLMTQSLHQATGEVLPRYGTDSFAVNGIHKPSNGKAAWFRQTRRRQQLLALIITDEAKAIADVVMKEMKRGVTAMDGTGMYSGKKHSILMCALTVTEIHQLKSLVNQVDPNSFIIVSPAQEVLGRGFLPLNPEGQD